MKLLPILILALTPSILLAQAPVERTLKVLCGTEAQLSATFKKYKEVPVIIAHSDNDPIVMSVWVNVMTQSSTWVLKTPEPDLYCVIGTGDKLTILEPKNEKIKLNKPLQ